MTAIDASPRLLRLSRRTAGTVPAAAVGLVSAAVLVIAPNATLAAGCALAAMVAVFVHPPTAAYVLIAVGPLVAGIDRGALIPVARPNEALLVLVAVPLVLRGASCLAASGTLRLRLTALDASLWLLALASSVWPLFWMTVRERSITIDDLLYALTLWKFLVVYLVVRASVRTVPQLRKCLWLSLGAAAIVGLVAILQSLHLFGVPQLLATWYAPFGDQHALEINRGTSLLASSFAVADVMTFNLAIAVAMIVKGIGPRLPLAGLSSLFLVGCVASGQFSGVIGLFVGLAVVGLVTRTLTRGALVAAPVLVVAGAVMQPVLERRINGFQTSRGLPSSWLARLDNLERFFWPELFRDFNWVFGVRPSARVPAPVAEWWREWVWIESGHTWLLWNGGIALLVAFVWFLVAAMRHGLRLCRRADEVGVAATALVAALAVIAVLTTFDPHLTMRGTGDLLFALLGLTFVQARLSPGDSLSDGAAGTGDGVPATAVGAEAGVGLRLT